MEIDPSFTVLDRLLLESHSGQIGASSQNALCASITRDLERLLNSRLPSGSIPAEFPECAASILNFGVPEFDTFGNLGNPTEQQKLCAAFTLAIGIFEPRLENVSVRLLGGRERNNLLRLQIEGTLTANREVRLFEAAVKPYASLVTVSPGGGA
jgi:type VI secretion system protein ImpF